MTNYQLKKLPVWKIVLFISVVLIGLTACAKKPANHESSGGDTSNRFSETFQLNTVYQFVSHIDGNFFCRGTYTFDSIDDNGIWHGSQSNFTQHANLSVTAKVLNDTIEIYTGAPWNETWKITSIEKGIFMGEMTGDYLLAQHTNITFELKEHVNISELMPDYEPKSTELVAGNIPFLKDEKYYWELWDEKTQTSSLSGWFMFKSYNSDTNTLSGDQYNYRTGSHTEFTATYVDNTITIKIDAPWNEVWTGEINNNVYAGEQSYNHNSTQFKEKGIRAWRMSTKPFEDRLLVFEELKRK